jgi:hypothetical protein
VTFRGDAKAPAHPEGQGPTWSRWPKSSTTRREGVAADCLLHDGGEVSLRIAGHLGAQAAHAESGDAAEDAQVAQVGEGAV